MIFKNIQYLADDFTVRTGSVVTNGDKITYVGDSPPADAKGEVIDGAKRLLIPGIVNAHSHVPMTLLRGYGGGLPLARWLNEKVFPFEDKMTAEDTYWASLVGIGEMLASGVTSFTDMYSFCEEIAEAVTLSGIKINISQGVMEFGDGGLADNAQHQKALRLIENLNGAANGRIIAEACLHAEYTSTERVVRETAQFAKERGVGIHIHLSETRAEHVEGIARRGVTPARYFEDCGIFESRVTAAHCTHISEDDMEILARRGVVAVHNPTSNLKLGSGIAPIPAMLKKGVTVALGTDGASSNNNLNMFEEIHLASLIHCGAAEDAMALTPQDVLRAATLGGAKAQGRHDVGLIKAGYKADLTVINLDKPHLSPSHDTLAALTAAAQGTDVEMTIADGEILYLDGKFLKFDIAEAMAKANAAAARILTEL